MPTFKELERAVAKLKPQVDDTGDRQLRVYCDRCGELLGRTKVSRRKGTGKDVGPMILGAVSRQLNVEAPLWRDILGCSKGRPEYVNARGHSHTPPPP